MNSLYQQNYWIGRYVDEYQRYRLEKWLGGGGMGDVFLATDTRLGQLVALKLLKESLAKTEEVKERFEREFAICAALKSQHIVQVRDYGVTSEGYPFYVMEYLQGETLGQRLTKQPRLTVAQTCSIITQVCAGLHLAHEGIVFWNGGSNPGEKIKVIHRDLKPDNILLVPTALGELAKIIDFGVAKIRSLQSEYTNSTTIFLGTCRYAAPEQLGVFATLDERADIYSLGVMLYEMLAGIDPFGFTADNKKVSGETWAAAHTSQVPKALRSQSGCEELSPELEAVVMRCLQKRPQDRFASVKDLSLALQSAVSGVPVSDIYLPELTSIPIPTEIQSQTDGTTRINPAMATTVLSDDTTLPKPQQNPIWRKFLWAIVGSSVLLLATGGYFAHKLSRSAIVQEVEQIEPFPEFTLTKTLTGHNHSVWSTAISHDGQTLVSGSEDKTIKVWDLPTGKLRYTLKGHTDTVRSLTLSADGKTLASSSGDKTIRLWNLHTGKLIRTLRGHSSTVWSVAISNDGKTLVSGSDDDTIKVWNLHTGQLRRILFGHSGPVFSVALSPDEKTFATGGSDRTIKVWDLQTGKLLRTLQGHSDSVRFVVFSPDGQRLASSSWDKTIRIWDLRNGRLLYTLEGHTARVVALAFSADSQTLASASIDKCINIWSLQTGTLLRKLGGHSDWVLSVAFGRTGDTLVSGSKDKTIKIWQR